MKKVSIVFLCCIALLLAGYAGLRSYRVWKQDHLVRLAREFLAKGDERSAALSLSQVLAVNPRNIAAARLMADLSEREHSIRAVLWRSRVLDLNPRSLDDRLALVRTALGTHDLVSATNALAGVDEAGRATAAYHNIAGAVAISANQTAQAEQHFQEAARLEPQNLAPQLNLAVVRVHSTNSAAAAEARTALKLLSQNPTNGTLRCQALRELVIDGLHQKQTADALALSKQLLRETNSVFADRLLRLEVLTDAKDPEFKPMLASVQRESATNPGSIYEVAKWQMGKGSTAEALAWLRTLPMKTQTNQPVNLLEAECFIQTRDWKGLQTNLAPQNWREVEFLRHAFLAQAFRGQGLTGGAQGEWELALKTAGEQKPSLLLLLRLAAQFGWLSETEDLLWTLFTKFPEEKWVFPTLNRALYANGRTRSLLKLYSQEVKRSPADFPSKNNLALVALLLDANEAQPQELALEVYQKSPTNSNFVSTYAFALHVRQKDADALKVIESLKAQDLESPGIAGYYGLILQGTGNPVKARKYLNLAFKGRLLPEERKLFERAGGSAL